MAAKPVLYTYWRSSCAWRVRIALALKGIDYESNIVHLVKDGGQQHTEGYKKLNPMEQLPCLLIDGQTLFQSLPIIEYLNETRPDVKLLPDDPVLRHKARALAEIVNCGIQPLQNLEVLQAIGDDKKMEWSKRWIEKGFDAFEQVVTETAGKYSVGDQVTLPDLCLVPQVYNANRFKADMSRYPTISRIHAELMQLPAFKVADAHNQPDTPEAERKQ
ncbi:maleylacetoacetate isomerase-like [Haliotis rubra]|uniref:maleylacetoacetate isomerase-like n=1 Tax=Haliotis rubra TaxID=36100 RepID=UPI001EE526C9|nr:maleylacetoacetate isomerase-like [Haliotis rubra]